MNLVCNPDQRVSRSDLLAMIERAVRTAKFKYEATDIYAMFDVDGCTVRNEPRTATIIDRFVTMSWRRDAPEYEAAMNALTRLRAEGLQYAPEENWRMVTSGFGESREPVFLSFWRDLFFSDAGVYHDEVMPGAPEFLRKVAAMCNIGYLTGRHNQTRRANAKYPRGMRDGTLAFLRKHGYPNDLLVCKDDFEEKDVAYKERWFKEAVGRGSPLPIVYADNESAIVRLHHEVMQDAGFHYAVSIFVDSVSASREPLPLAAKVVKNFL